VVTHTAFTYFAHYRRNGRARAAQASGLLCPRLLLCMTPSLAEGGAVLGTMGLPETRLRALATEAGFSSVRRLPLENSFNTLYELKP
jgi:hypothetical protein